MTVFTMPTEAELDAIRKLDDRRKAAILHSLIGALVARAQMPFMRDDVQFSRELLVWLSKEAKE